MFLPLPLRRRIPAEAAHEGQRHDKAQQLRAEGANQMLLPPQSTASRSSTPACSTSPRPMEMHRAERGRSTAVRKPPMRILKPTSRYDRAYRRSAPVEEAFSSGFSEPRKICTSCGPAGKYRQSRPPS